MGVQPCGHAPIPLAALGLIEVRAKAATMPKGTDCPRSLEFSILSYPIVSMWDEKTLLI